MKNAIFTIFAAAVIVFALSGVAGYESYGSGSAEDAIAQNSVEIKKLRAVMAMCGGNNAVATEIEDGLYQCQTKRGHSTIKIAFVGIEK